MKKFIIILTFLLGTQVSATKKVDKKEYSQLILQCQAIRARTLQENNFETIRQNAIRHYQLTNAQTAERFTAIGGSSTRFSSDLQGTLISDGRLKSSLDALETAHNLRVNALIAQTIIAFLTATNTTAANKLLSELIANGFVF